MRLFTALALLVTACGQEKLNFALPDSGRNDRDAGMHSPPSSACADGSSICRASSVQTQFGDDGGPVGRASGGTGGTPSTTDGNSVGGRGAGASGQGDGAPDQYQDDPSGYPTGPGQLAASCAQGVSIPEICGNDIDDDCDETVDEYPGIGSPCQAGCGQGIYVCDASTNELLCRGEYGCSNPVPPPCGDGFVGSDEACDPNAQGEQPGVTCTLTCERPLFIRCVDSGIAHPELCDELHVCDEHIGACMPVIGPRQPRCPQLPIEGDATKSQFYPMLETEGGECWVTCTQNDQCPSSLSECYMAFCAVPL